MADIIRPVDFSGVVQRSHEVSNLKQNEDNKPLMDQQNIQKSVEKDIQRAAKEVIKKQDADYHQTNYDAKDEGRGQKYNNQTENKKKVKDAVVKKDVHKGFDIKI